MIRTLIALLFIAITAEAQYAYPGRRWQPADPATLGCASGAGGHRIMVMPTHDLVIVHQVPTGGVGLFAQLRRRFFGGPNVEDEEVAKLLQLILAAKP